MGEETGASVRRLGGACVVDLNGDITSFSEQAIKGAWAEAASSGVRQVVLNFEKVSYMNSAGIAILIDLVAEARKREVQLALVWRNEHFRKILKMVGLTRYITVYSTEPEALAGV